MIINKKKSQGRTYTAEIAIEYLDKMMDNLKDLELIILSINAHAEIQARIPDNHKYKQVYN